MKKFIIINILFTALVFSSCVDDLNVTPKDPELILSANIANDPAYMEQVLAKIYASFYIPGQGGNADEQDGPDITAGDPNFFTTMRALWNMQEITTDEAICAWGDVGIADMNTQTWSPSNPFLTALYQRLSISITFANDFINQANSSSLPDKEQYIAEARFLRALAYFYHMDMFGNPPFTTEADGVGKFFPEQIDRVSLFDYVVAELEAISGADGALGEPGTSYPQADKGAAWMLLSRIYLNAEVYTGTAMYDKCVEYTTKVIESGAYGLADDYRHNFSADNDYARNNEMIFAWESDGINTQGYMGVTFIIESCSDNTYLPAEDYHGLTENTNWEGNRARRDFIDFIMDTVALYGGSPMAADTFFNMYPDNRIYMRQKLSADLPEATSTHEYGVGVYKFTARNHDGSEATNYHTAYTSTDYPIFRLAEAYISRAEANYKLDKKGDAVADFNVIRERAEAAPITVDDLNDRFILAERGREFYYEGHRRTDLIRFGQFSNGDYHWQWKGGVEDGTSTGSHLDLFPIPSDEISSNPNLEQNPGYN